MNAPREVHPVADLFPMLADDELAELAEDIKQRGLLQPVVLDPEGRVLDGRNRLVACEQAGVKPEFTTYEGDDPNGYALAVNGQRREMTKRQKAIVAAQFSKLENYGDQRKAARALGVSDGYVSEALVIVEYARELAHAVIVGAQPFNDALNVARTRQARERETGARMDRLRESAPDLLEHVDEERMSLDDAIAALDAREEKARQEAEQKRGEEEQRATEAAAHARRVSESLRMAINTITKAFGTEELRQRAAESYLSPEVSSEVDGDIQVGDLKAAADICRDLARRWGK